MRLLLYKRNVLLLLCAAYHAVQAFVPVSLRMGTTGAPTNPPASATNHMISASPAAVNSRGSRGMTRADAARAVGATIAGTLALKVTSCAAAVRSKEDLVRLLREARTQLDPVDQMIEDAKWDGIRNIIKTSPLADVKNVIAELARQSDEDDSALLLGLRQDVLDHVQYLDSFSYNNVFVGEERQILGTKIDFDTPRMELRQAREAFDIIMEVLP
ncbi:unnamed protein product [Ectocarpus sp. 8 AP-2014]